MLIVDQEDTALLAATVKAAGCRYDQGILGADCITSRRTTADPSGVSCMQPGNDTRRQLCQDGRRIFLVCRCVTILAHRAPLMWLPCDQLPA